jgi:tRNA nucleotidyltransferase (CCA-adding enzyme)
MTTGQDLIRLALWAAQSGAAGLDAADQALMISAVQMNVIERLTPSQRGRVLGRALMSPYPVVFFTALRDCAGLRRLLPELDALFGVPQLADSHEPLDVGEHQLRVLAETARRNAPLAVRFAALAHKIGKGGTPSGLWPSHVGHEARGAILLARLAERITLPADALDLAALTIAECDRVHRSSDMRAGAIAALLERVQAETRPERFERLLNVCLCDYAAYPGHGEADYAQAPRMHRALAAYLAVREPAEPDTLLRARATAIARAALRAERQPRR